VLDALRGRFDESRDALDEAERSQENALGSMWTGPPAITRGELALWSGRPDEARDAIVAMLDRVEPADEDAFYLTPVLAVGARAAADIAVAARATGTRRRSGRPARSPPRSWTGRVTWCTPIGFPAGRCPPESLLNVATAQAEHARAVG
jgi:hypothetical protein